MTAPYETDLSGASTRPNPKPQPQNVHRLARLLDSSVRLPGGFRIGLDGLLGLIPGVGDFIGGSLSTWIFYQANRQGAPKSLQLRMILNILVDVLLGAIPVVGDLFDFMWKANNKNIALLERYQQEPLKTRRRASLGNTLFLIAALACIGFAIWVAVLFVSLLWQRINAY